ncbi:MAG: chalcone isomerase family protein, partial [Kangiellaceae bacterium]
FSSSLIAQDSQGYTPQAKAKILERTLIPTGYGLTKFLNKDFYLARFSIDESADYINADDLIYLDAARRMEFKFVSDKISSKTFWRRLSQGMKINNDRDALKDNLVFVKQLKTFFRRVIKKGDVIRFDYHRDFGTRVYHNKRFLGEISDSREFYRFIVNVWFGNRPPSNRFKEGLLGRNGDDYAINMQHRFENE